VRSRLSWVFLLGIVWVAAIVLRLYQLQVVLHPH
jgi:hypothetical protein